MTHQRHRNATQMTQRAQPTSTPWGEWEMNSTQINRARLLRDRGFTYGDIAQLVSASMDDVYFAIHGRKRPTREKSQTTADIVAELLSDIPEGRDPAEHRRCVMANFVGAA